MRFIDIGMEDDKQPVVEQEKEVVIYVKIGDPEGLKEAFKVEEQFQGQIKTSVGSIRVRRSKHVDGTYVYEQTTKVLKANTALKEMTESTLVITKEVFDHFLSVVPTYMDKTRYSFKAEKVTVTVGEKTVELDPEDLIYEVDVFKDKDGKESEWCKIDIEVQKLSKKLEAVFGNDVPDIDLTVKINQLPFKPNNFVLEDESTNEDKKKLITTIYDEQFLIKNPALAGSE